MYIILGATGNIGSQIVKLLSVDHDVIGVTHTSENQFSIEASGAQAKVADVNDTEQLVSLFKKGDVLYVLNPPGNITKNPSQEELASIHSIVSAVKESGITKVVAESTYGAQPGNDIGDLGSLYEMEKLLGELYIDLTIIRGAYYFTNWDMQLESAKNEGKIYSLFPANFRLPMVSPKDIATFAVEKLTSAVNEKNKLCRRSGTVFGQ